MFSLDHLRCLVDVREFHYDDLYSVLKEIPDLMETELFKIYSNSLFIPETPPIFH